MKPLLTGIVCLIFLGCVSTPPTPPAGCETAMVWQSGFMPKGPDLVELGFAALLTAEPNFKVQVKNGALKAWHLVKARSLKGAVAELMVLLEKYPQYTPLALFALKRLDLERTLDPCDQKVLLGMCQNIAIYAGAREHDFEDGLAGLTGYFGAKDD